MNKSLNQNNIIAFYDTTYVQTTGPVSIFIRKDHVREHVSSSDQLFYSVRPLCVKRGDFIDRNIDYYFNIKNYLVDMINKSDADYFVLTVDDTSKEFTDPDGFKHQYYTSKLQMIHNETLISKLEECNKPRLEEYASELFDD